MSFSLSTTLLDGPGWTALVRALGHTLWLGAAVAGALALILRGVPARRANLRHALCVAALGLVLAGGLGVWALGANVSRRGPTPTSSPVHLPVAAGRTETAPMPAATPPFPTFAGALRDESAAIHPWTGWLAGGWLVGVLVTLGRTARATAGAERLRREARPVTDEAVLAVTRELAAALRLSRRVAVLVSTGVAGPAVLGVLRPAVLLPASWLTGCPPEHLRAILAHELVHVARWDYAANLLQRVGEALLFFNPFVWWIGAQLRREREACCDARAAELCATPADYVEALAAVVAAGRGGERLPALALAMSGGKGEPSTLLDRARRLLVPGYRPGGLRLGRAGLAMAMLTAAAGIVLLGLGARVAAQALTPAERIARTAELRRETMPFDPPLTGSAKSEIEVSGTVVGADGTPPGQSVQVIVRSDRPGHASSTGLNPHADGHFSTHVPPGIVWVGAWGEGHAPAFLGPLRPDRDPVTDLRLVLTPGFDAAVQVRDESGQPVAGAEISGRYDGPVSVGNLRLRTDAAGLAPVPHVGDAPLILETTVPGFEMARLDGVRLRPGTPPLPWTLQRAVPLAGTVRAVATGQPVAGALVKLAFTVEGPGPSSSHEPQTAPLLATADAAGRFRLDTLRADTLYALYVEAPGHGGVLVPGVRVRPNGEELTVNLPPALAVRGRIVHAPHAAPDAKPAAVQVTLKQTFQVHGEGRNGIGYVTRQSVNVSPRDDGSGEFAFENLYAAPAELEIAGRTVPLPDLAAPVADLVVDVAAVASTPKWARTAPIGPTRAVVLRFDVPAGAPAPAGTLTVQREVGRDRDGIRSVQDVVLPVEAGEVRLEVPVPGELTYDSPGLIGYAVVGDWTARRVKVPEGEGPLVVKVPVRPAGAIYGEVFEADGRPAGQLFISVVRTKVDQTNGNWDLTVKNSTDGSVDVQSRFVATPLPFGAEYVVVVNRAHTFVLSDPQRVDERHPLPGVRLVLPRGQTLPGRLVPPDGVALPTPEELTLRLQYQPPWGYARSGAVLPLDAQGRFSVAGVNFAAPGTYVLRGESRARFLPFEVPVREGETPAIPLRAGRTLAGTVVDGAGGQPVPGVEIWAMIDDYTFGTGPHSPTPGFLTFEAEARTDETGRFRFSNLPDTPVRLQTRNVNAATPGPAPVARPGQAAEVRLPVTGRPTL